jgi:hypothetical protein
MLHHHEILRADQFSYSVHGKHFVVTEWLFCVVLAGLVGIFGSSGGFILAAMAGVVGVVSVAWMSSRLGASRARSCLLAGVSGLLAGGYYGQERALGFSLGFFALTLGVLAVGRRRRVMRWWLVALTLLWVNVHGSAVVVLVAVGLEGILLLLRGSGSRAEWRNLSGVGAGCALMLGCTPWGYGDILYGMHIAASSQLRHTITEWQPLNLHSTGLLIIVLVIGGLVVRGVTTRWRSSELWWVILLLGATLHSSRFTAYLLVGCAAFLAGERRLLVPGISRLGQNAAVWGMALVFGLGGFFLPYSAGSTDGYPVALLGQAKDGGGRVFSYYPWASYGVSVGVSAFVDGETDEFLGRVYGEYLTVARAGGGTERILSSYNVRWVLWPDATVLERSLMKSRSWKRVGASHGAVLFLRRG